MSVGVKEKVHGLREGLKEVEPNGIVGTLLVGWWIAPMKFIADPVLGIAETVVPGVASVVPFAEPMVGFGLDVTTKAGTAVHGVGKSVGILKKGEQTEKERKDEMHQSVISEAKELIFEGFSLQKTGIAFGLSMSMDLLSAVLNPFKLTRWVEAVCGIGNFLKMTGISDDLFENAPDLLHNLIILGKTQDEYHDKLIEEKAESTEPTVTELDEGFRFMKYATAAYGAKTISAANDQQIANDQDVINTVFKGDTGPGLAARLDIKDWISGKYLIDTPSEFITRQKVSQHVGIPESDMIMFVKPGGSVQCLRHFIAVDHKNKEVILALRGTYSLSELLVDASADNRDFCNGKAHSGIADVTDKLWEVCGDVVNAVLAGFPEYKLVITGHSLGGGAACLLTIKIYAEGLVKPGTNVECMSYASPAVFTPLQAAETAVSKTTNFIHDNDCVSFLSAGNARELFDSIEVVDKKKGNFWQQLQVIMGAKPPSDELIKSVKIAGIEKETDIKGAERSFVPAKKIVWMRKNKESEEYKAYNFLADKLPEIYVNEDMIFDHFPPFYEEALNKLTDRE